MLGRTLPRIIYGKIKVTTQVDRLKAEAWNIRRTTVARFKH